MDQLGLVDRKIQAVVMAAIVAGHPIGIDDSVDFAAAVWLLRYDHFAVADAVIVVVGRTIVANLTLEGFHDLYDRPMCVCIEEKKLKKNVIDKKGNRISIRVCYKLYLA